MYATDGTPITASIKLRFALLSTTDATEATKATAEAWSEPRSKATSHGLDVPDAGSNICATKCVKIRNQATSQSCKREEWICRFRPEKIPPNTATVTTVGIFSKMVIQRLESTVFQPIL